MTLTSVLVIDDDEGDRYLARHAFKKYDRSINVIEAYDGFEALKMLDTIEVDAIVLDINMPVMNGYEFLVEYKVKYPIRQIPIFTMLTSSQNDIDREKAGKFDVVKDFLTKPLDTDKIKRIEAEVLASRGVNGT